MNLDYVLTVKCSHELVDLLSDIGQLDEIVECRVIVNCWRGHRLNLVFQSNQTQRKQFRVGAAEMGARRVYSTGVRGHAPPGNFEI